MTGIRLRVWFGIITLLLVWSCAWTGARTDHSAELLAQNYASMSDKELQTYHSQLSDQIARVQRAAAGPSTRTRAGGDSLQKGANKNASTQSEAEKLRDRWNEVRAELRRRGSRP